MNRRLLLLLALLGPATLAVAAAPDRKSVV